jgi:Zn-dependent M28 family amino/carboxypeptidase
LEEAPLLVTEIRSVEPEKFILSTDTSIHPYCMGATDNISGDTAIMEVAHILNKHKEKLRRSVRIAYWTGHDRRVRGSTWFNDAFGVTSDITAWRVTT